MTQKEIVEITAAKFIRMIDSINDAARRMNNDNFRYYAYSHNTEPGDPILYLDEIKNRALDVVYDANRIIEGVEETKAALQEGAAE